MMIIKALSRICKHLAWRNIKILLSGLVSSLQVSTTTTYCDLHRWTWYRDQFRNRWASKGDTCPSFDLSVSADANRIMSNWARYGPRIIGIANGTFNLYFNLCSPILEIIIFSYEMYLDYCWFIGLACWAGCLHRRSTSEQGPDRKTHQTYLILKSVNFIICLNIWIIMLSEVFECTVNDSSSRCMLWVDIIVFPAIFNYLPFSRRSSSPSVFTSALPLRYRYIFYLLSFPLPVHIHLVTRYRCLPHSSARTGQRCSAEFAFWEGKIVVKFMLYFSDFPGYPLRYPEPSFYYRRVPVLPVFTHKKNIYIFFWLSYFGHWQEISFFK